MFEKLLCPAILLFLVCCADYDEIEGRSAGLGGSYWHSSEGVARDNRIYGILYFSDGDTVFEYEGYPDGTPVSSAKTAYKYSYSNGEAARQACWIDDFMQKTLPVKHYHLVFTVPHHLTTVCLHNQRRYYDLLFAAVWNTLHSFGYAHFGVETGAVAVLHSWGQNLSLHPHIHCLVPAAGYALDGRWKTIGHSGNYLYPVLQLSTAFKGKFLDSLKRTLRKQDELSFFNSQIKQAYQTKWVVHCEPSLASAEHVVRYLGQYTHRVAITNQRILNITGGRVTFIAKDYRDRAVKKPVTLDGVEFLRRFTLHILPKRFVKIRRFGIYNHTVKRDLKLQFVPQQKLGIDTVIKKQQPPETNVERFTRLTGINPCLCPVCKTGRTVTVSEMPRIHTPAWGCFCKPAACS